MAGNEILFVSKPHLEYILAIYYEFEDYKNNILFRFTIGSVNDETLHFWEPGAASFDERIASLKFAYDTGYQTSISCSPTHHPRAAWKVRWEWYICKMSSGFFN